MIAKITILIARITIVITAQFGLVGVECQR